jgi:outer membrane protein
VSRDFAAKIGFMIRWKLSLLAGTLFTVLVGPMLVEAQLSKIAIVDFERAVVESAEGKKASEKFNATFKAKQEDLEKRQKDIDDSTKKLQNGARTLTDAAKAEIQKDIDRKNTELQRLNEDAKKELQALRDELLRPIAEKATALMNALAEERGYTLVVDISNPQTNIAFWNPNYDVTGELIKRIDAAPPAASEAPKQAAPAAGATRPATQTPAAPKSTAPATPPTTTAPKR